MLDQIELSESNQMNSFFGPVKLPRGSIFVSHIVLTDQAYFGRAVQPDNRERNTIQEIIKKVMFRRNVLPEHNLTHLFNGNG